MKAAINHRIRWTCLAVCVFLISYHSGAQTLVRGEYFYDNDPGLGIGTELSVSPSGQQDFSFNAPVGDLDPGYHYLSIRFQDSDGAWGISQTTEFYINGPEQELPPFAALVSITRGEYFWGADPGPGSGISFFVPVGQNINFSATINGPPNTDASILGIRFQDLSGTWGVAANYEVNAVDNDLSDLPDQDFSYSPNPGVAGNAINFSDQSSGVDANALFQWDVDGDNDPDYFGANIQHSFVENGLYPVRQIIVNNPSGLAQTADVQFYFRNGSLEDAAGTFIDLANPSNAEEIDGRAGDASGARNTGPAILTATAVPQPVDSFTVAFWVKGNGFDDILRIGQSDGTQFRAFFSATEHRVGNTNILAGSSGILYDGNWHHIALKYEGGQAQSFLDGDLIQSKPVSVSVPFNLNSLQIGGISETDFADGILDDLSFFKRALSGSEIESLAFEVYASALIKTVQVGNLPDLAIQVSGTTLFCEGEVAILSAPEADAYLWSTGATDQSILVEEPGNYLCQLTIGNQLLSTELVNIVVLPTPQVELTAVNASNGLSNGSAGVSVSGGNAFTYQYAWTSGSQLLYADNLGAGNYSVTVSDGVCPVNLAFDIENTEPTESPLIVEGEYFFGPDLGVGTGVPFAIPQGQETEAFFGIVAPDSLTLNSQVKLSFRTKDDQGAWSITKSRAVNIYDITEPEVYEIEDLILAEYFIDSDDPGPGMANPLPSFTQGTDINLDASIPTTGLQTGPHTLNVRIKDENGSWGLTRTSFFSIEFIIPPTLPEELLTLVQAEYFIGSEDPGTGNAFPVSIPPGNSLDIQRTIDTSELPEGEFSLSFRTRDITGQWSTTKTTIFEIIPVVCIVPEVDFAFNSVQAGQTVNLTNLSTSIDGQTLYTWDIGADGSTEFSTQDASTVFSSPGIYDVKLTVNNGDECIVNLVKQIEVGPVLSNLISLSGPSEFCDGNTLNLTAPAGSIYLWNTLETSQSIDVVDGGSYSCIYTDANGNQAYTNAIEVVVYPILDVIAEVSAATDGNANGSAAVFASGGSTFTYTYLWSNGVETQVNTGLNPGTYTVVVSDEICPANVSIEVENLISSGDLSLVSGEYFFGDDPGIGNATPLNIPQSGNFDIYTDISTDNLSPGYLDLSVRLRQSNGIWGIAMTIPVSISDPNPEVVDTLPSVIVAAEYFLNDEDPGPGNAIVADAFASSQSILASSIIETLAYDLEPGPVKVSTRVKDALGNWSITKSIDFFIQVEPGPNLSDSEWPIVAAEYFLGQLDPGPGLANPIAFNPALEANVNESIDLSGLLPGFKQITIRVKDANGKWSVAKTIPFEITPVNCPVPNVSFSNTPANIGGNTTLQNTSSNTLASATYSWDIDEDGLEDASGQSTQLSVPDPGTYFVTLAVDNGNGCVASKTRDLFIGPSFNNLIANSGDLNFCEGDSVILTAPNGSDYLWNTEETSQSITVKEVGTYSVYYTNSIGTPSYASGAEVEVFPMLVIETIVNNPTNGNNNGSAGVLVSGGSQFFYSYNWNSGESTALIANKPAGNYTVAIADQHCPETISLDLQNQNVQPELVSAEYFWDLDPGVGNATAISIPESTEIQLYAEIETDGLEIGYHQLNIRAQRSSGAWGVSKTIPVYLSDPNPNPPPVPPTDLVELEYFIDEDSGIGTANVQSVGPSAAISEDISLSVTGLSPGPHHISTRVRNANGEWGVSKSSTFEICNPPPIPVLVSESEEVCMGGSVTLKVTDLTFDITWITPSGATVSADSLVLTNIELQSGGMYQVFAQSEPGCFSGQASFALTVLQPPVITTLVTGPYVICNTQEAAELFIPPIEFATNYNWQLPVGASIISGNNTNNISIDFSNVAGSQALVVLAASNLCGSDTASAFLVNFECGVICNVDGGVLSASGNLNPCVGDGEPSAIQLSVTGNVGNSRFGIIKTNGDVVASNGTGLFNMDNYPPGIYRFAHLSSGPGFSFAGVTNANQLSGCFNTSNLITFSTYQPDGGTISLVGSNIVCGGTGTPTILPFTLEGSVGPNQRWAVLNQTFTQSLALSVNPNFNWDNFSPGIYQVVHAAYGDQVNLGQVDPQNIQGCIDASNVITVSVQSCGGLVALSTYPNPTDGISNVSFELSEEQTALLEVYDLSGRLVQTLFNSVASAEAKYRFTFDGSALPNGVYLYRLTTDSEVVIEKFMIAH